MADDSKAKKLKDDIEKVDESIKKLDQEAKERSERKVSLQDEIETKSKLVKRPMIEDIRKRNEIEANEDSPDGKSTRKADDLKGSGGHKGGIADKDAESKGSSHGGGGHGHTGGHASPHEDAQAGEQSGGQGAGQASQAAADIAAEEASQDASDASDGGDGHTTGGTFPRKKTNLYGVTAASLMQEAVLRHWDSRIRQKGQAYGQTMPELSQRLWLASQTKGVMEEHMIHDLKRLEDSSRSRLKRMNDLNAGKAAGLSKEQEKELRGLEDQEAMRYWLRERLLRKVPMEKQEEFDWLQPIGNGAYAVMPYTVITAWDRLSQARKVSARWHADNQWLRWQNSILGQFLPKKPSLKWFQEGAKKGLETLFDDLNEELYSDKKWAEMVKKGQADLEKIEEEISGYDAFTVAEEKQMAKMFDDYIKKETELAKMQQEYQG
jgi:hypothetical protein